MKSPPFARRQRLARGFSVNFAVLCLQGLAIAGCSSTRQSAPLAPAQSVREPIAALGAQDLEPESNSAALFVSEAQHNTVAILNNSDKKIGTIHIGAGRLAVDKEGDLYTENGVYGTTVTVFAPPYKTGTTIKVTQNEHVGAVAVDPNSDIWAAVLFANGGGTPKVAFFKHGATKPCNTLPSNVEQNSVYAAFDGEGTLFFLGENPDFVLVSISGGCKATGSVIYPSIGEFLQMGFDTQDNLVVQTAGPIDIYAHPSNGQIGQPIGSLSLKPIDKKYNPALLALTADGKHLWAGICCIDGQNTIGLYAYPAGGAPIKTIGGLPEPAGVATIPTIDP